MTDLVLIELAQQFPDQADRAAALLGLVVVEFAAMKDQEERAEICKDAYRAFYLGSLRHDPAQAMEVIGAEQ